MSRKIAAQFKIRQRNTLGELTRPEVAFDKLYGNKVVRPLPITVGDGMKLWALKPDRHHPYVQKEVSVFLQISREWTRKIAA